MWIVIQQRFFREGETFDFYYKGTKYRVYLNRSGTEKEDIKIKDVKEVTLNT